MKHRSTEFAIALSALIDEVHANLSILLVCLLLGILGDERWTLTSLHLIRRSYLSAAEVMLLCVSGVVVVAEEARVVCLAHGDAALVYARRVAVHLVVKYYGLLSVVMVLLGMSLFVVSLCEIAVNLENCCCESERVIAMGASLALSSRAIRETTRITVGRRMCEQRLVGSRTSDLDAADAVTE
ncbi:hypothetical protein Tco_0401895 [Tanacetum coccineum]